MKEEVGKYAYRYETKAAIKRCKSKYPQYTFVITTINNENGKFDKQKEHVSSLKFNKLGEPNIAKDDLLQEIKDVVIGVRLSGTAISGKTVISIGNEVLKANDPNTLSEFSGTITLADDWARGILQSMEWGQTQRNYWKR